MKQNKKIYFHKNFLKNFVKRIRPDSQLVSRYEERVRLFLTDENNPLLRTHELKGKFKDKKAFSVNGDVRVIYTINESVLLLIDIGTHNQVYN